MADSMENIVLNENGQVTFATPEGTEPVVQPTDQPITDEVVESEGVEEQPIEEQYYTADEVRQLGLNADPKRLPPELVPFYKSMQADYTRKSQEIAEQRRQYERMQWEQEQRFNQPQQQAQPQSNSMKEYYNKLNEIAIQNAEQSLGEKLQMVDEYGVPNYVHQAAYQDAIANIKIQLYEQKLAEEGTKKVEQSVNQTINKYQSDPDWNEIAQFAVKMMHSMPYESAVELQNRFKRGDTKTLDRYLSVVKEEFEKQKYPARRSAPQAPSNLNPPNVQSANTVPAQTKPGLDPKQLGSMSSQEQTAFIKSFLSAK